MLAIRSVPEIAPHLKVFVYDYLNKHNPYGTIREFITHMTSPKPIIVWFRDDLRLSDHPALHAAAKTGAPVVCLYVLDEESPARPLGGAARWWLAQSLRRLQASLQSAGTQLVLPQRSTRAK